MSEFVGIIPAAGSGSRLGLPYPKELHSVEPGILYIDYSIEQLARAGVKKAYIVVSPPKLTPMASALKYERRGVELVYVEAQPTDSKSLAGSVLRGCRRANYQHDYDKFVVLLPDTKLSCPDVATALVSLEAPCMALFDVQDPSAYDAVYGSGRLVTAVTVKQPLDADLGEYQGIWGALTLDYQAVLRLRRIIKATPKAEGQSDHHLFGELLNADAKSGGRHYYVKPGGEFVDLGEWGRVHEHVAGMTKKEGEL